MTALSCACHVPYECVVDGGGVAAVSVTVDYGGFGANLECLSDDSMRGAVSPVVGHSLVTRAARLRSRVQA